MLHNLIVTPSALAESEVRTFPVSKNRSKRIHKKLVKRHGGEFKMKPAAFQVGGRIILHPTLYAELLKTPIIRDVARPAVSLAGLFSTPPVGAMFEKLMPEIASYQPIMKRPWNLMTTIPA